MITVSCRDVGVDCDYVAKGETEEEIMRDAGEHAVRDHGYKKDGEIMTPQIKDKNSGPIFAEHITIIITVIISITVNIFVY